MIFLLAGGAGGGGGSGNILGHLPSYQEVNVPKRWSTARPLPQTHT